MTPRTPHPRLTDAQLQRALNAPGDSIVPSSGFADSVMAAVREEATAPAPIPFPWKRALPGVTAALAALSLLAVVLISLARALMHAPAAPASAIASFALHVNSAETLAWTLLVSALLGTLLFCRRLLSNH